MAEGFSIGALAKAAGVGVETIRYYERLKLINQPARPYGRIRRYKAGDLERLRFIKRAQSAGFSLYEIETLVQLRQRVSCEATRQMAAHKLLAIEARLAELRGLRDELMNWIAQCEANSDDACCPALDALATDQGA